ncbi:MAG: CHAT domain-containing protein [Kofleriaceae bacterium]
MRVTLGIHLLLAALLSFGAHAGPAPKKPQQAQPSEAEKKQINDVQKDMYDHYAKQQYAETLKLAKQLIDLQTKAYGPDSQQVLSNKSMLAGIYTVMGDYATGLQIHKEILAADERVYGAESREVEAALSAVAGAYWSQNRIEEAEPYMQRNLALTKKLEGDKSIQYAGLLTSYGALLQMHNEYAASIRIYEEALAVYEATAKTKDDQQVLGAVQMLANGYWQANEKQKAMKLYDRAIQIATNAPNGTVMTRASTMWSVSTQYHYGGRDDLAKPLQQKTIELYKAEIARLEKDKPDDPMLNSYYLMLGYTYRQSDDLVNAEKLFKTLIADEEKKKPGTISNYTGTLAEIENAEGHPKEALALYLRSAEGMSKFSPMSAHAYDTTIADVERQLGDYKKAEQLLIAYEAYAGKQYGKKHPAYTSSLTALGTLYSAMGEIPKAETDYAAALEAAEHDLTNVLRTGTESDHAIYFAKNGYQLDLAINFAVTVAPKSPAAARLALTTLLRRKGRVLDAAAASMATIRSKLSPEDKKLLDQLADARTKLSKLTVAGPLPNAGDDYAKQVAALEDQIQKLEIEVGKKSAQYRAAVQSIDLAPIQKLIPKDTKLVELVNFQPNDPKAGYQMGKALPPRRFAAFVLGQKGDPIVVDLGPASAIDDAVEKFRKAVSNPKNTKVGDLGNALYKLTIGKLGLGSTQEVLIAPDGTLNVVPFSALVDDKGKLLLDSFNFTYLTSGRDLLRLQVKSKSQGGGVIFADPAFDATGAKSTDGSRGARAADLQNLMWPQLPGTGQEADEVEKTFKGLTEYRGDKATETAIKALHGPKILHLATHGFFLSDEPTKKSRSAEPAPAVVGMFMQQAPQQTGAENPLLRSGLALAGANKLQSGDEDGILTSMEASGLDLWGTKLVVLSACDTGNGTVTNGEGVYGLRRALVIAGAEGLVMSLWQVDDFATRDLMAGYYARLKAGKPRSDALRDIQREIAAKPKYAHPYYWAAFVAAGDNTPIN